ncbi:MAG: hypothetical protein V5A39_03230 [Haloarculaceae archaeon]
MIEIGDKPSHTLHDPRHILEDCSSCQRETPHHVSIEIREENPDPERAAYSREPYRVSVCARCEREKQVRMNDR